MKKLDKVILTHNHPEVGSFGKDDFELLKEHNIILPNTILFSKKVLDKTGKKIGYRDDINDLLKDIYRYAR